MSSTLEAGISLVGSIDHIGRFSSPPLHGGSKNLDLRRSCAWRSERWCACELEVGTSQSGPESQVQTKVSILQHDIVGDFDNGSW